MTLNKTNCDWLFDMLVKLPHGWALANKSYHIFQTFSHQSEGLATRDYFILMQYKLKMLQFIPNAPSTFLWAMSDAHLRMIHYFESIVFKGFIKPVDKPVNWFANQFECFVQFPAALTESSEVVLTQSSNRKFKNIKSIESLWFLNRLEYQSVKKSIRNP